MKHARQLWGVLCLTAAWGVAAEKPAKLAGPEPSRFAIPRIAKAPVIDGAIDEREEWKQAVRLSGVSPVGGGGPIDPRVTEFFLAWDDQHLYLAGRSELRDQERLWANQRVSDNNVVYDDSYEIGFDTLGRSTKPGDDPACYKLSVNVFNRIDSLKSLPTIGGFNWAWAPEFQRASRITPDRKYWELELAMPVKSLEQLRENRAGDGLRLLLGRNYKSPWNQCAVPRMGSGYFDSVAWLLGTLADQAPFVRVSGLEQMSRSGKALCRVTVVNPGTQPVKVDVSALWTGQSPTGEKDRKGNPVMGPETTLERVKSLDVPAGASTEFTVDEPLPGDKGTLALKAVAAGGAALLDTTMSYAKGQGDKLFGPDAEYRTRIPQPGTFPLAATYNPARNLMWLQGDKLDLAWAAAATSLAWTVAGADGAIAATGAISRAQVEMFQDLISLPALKPGIYTVNARLLDSQGKAVAQASNTIEKADEKARFPWLGNKIGDPERVIPPFEAVKRVRGSGFGVQDKKDGVKGSPEPRTLNPDTFSCWGREYTLGGLGLPLAMRSQKEDVLAGAVRIVVVRDGKETVVPLDGQPEITKTTDWRISYRGKAEGAGLTFNVEGCLEQDGCLFYKLTYAPADGKPVTLDALRLEYPLKDAEAELMYCVGPGGNYAGKKSDFVPKGQGRVWSTLELGRQTAGMTVGTFFPQVWLGNERRGFIWWAASDKGWTPDADVPAHEILRASGQVILRNNIIGKPFELAGPRTIDFVLNATPYKPLRPGWRLSTTSLGRFSGPGFKQEGNVKGWLLLHAPARTRAEWPAIYARYKQGADHDFATVAAWDDSFGPNFNASGLPIMGYGDKSLEKDVLAYFQAEWDDSFNPSQQDYYLSLMEQWVKEGGLKRFYFDITFPRVHGTLLNGDAYLLPDGRIQPGFNVYGMRRFYMRVFAMMNDRGCMPRGFTGHSSNDYPMMLLPWMEVLLDGEFNHVGPGTPFEWIDGITAARLRSMCIPGTWGTPFDWLIKIHAGPEWPEGYRQADSAWGWLRLHDNWFGRPDYAYWAWGLGREDVQFLPYWRSSEVAKANDPRLKASLWRHGDGVMAMVYNDDKTGGVEKVGVDLDLKALGLLPLKGEKLFFAKLGGETEGAPVLDLKSGRLSGFGLKPRKWTTVTVEKAPVKDSLPIDGLHAWGAAKPDPDVFWRWGAGRTDAQFVPHTQADARVKSAAADVKVSFWQRPDRILLLIRNDGAAKQTLDVTVDLVKFGIMPVNPLKNRVGFQALQSSGLTEGGRGGLTLDPHTGQLSNATLESGGWVVYTIQRH